MKTEYWKILISDDKVIYDSISVTMFDTSKIIIVRIFL